MSTHVRFSIFSKTCLKPPLKNRQNEDLNDNGSLMKAESIAECSKGNILHILSTSIKLPFSIKTLVLSILSGRLRQVLLYIQRECSGSVVECLTRDREAAGSSLTGVRVLWSLSKTHLS